MREEMRKEERRKAVESETGVESDSLPFSETLQCSLHILALHNCLFDGY